MRPIRWLYTIPLRLRSLFRRNRVEQELDNELRDHVDRQVAENTARGMSPEEARYAALQAIEGIEKSKEESRDARGMHFLESLVQDTRYGLRMLRKNPGFTLIVVLTLTLGVGANTAIFSVANDVFLRPLPFPHEDRLVRIHAFTATPSGEISRYSPREREVFAVQEQSTLYDGFVALDDQSLTLRDGDKPERIHAAVESPGWSAVLVVQPVLGRLFTAEEENREEGSGVAIIGYGLWQRRFGGNRNVLGSSIVFDDRTCRIIGVMPRGFRFPYLAEVWLPISIHAGSTRREYAFFASLKPGVTLPQANAEMSGIAARLRQQFPDLSPGSGLIAEPIRVTLIGGEDQIALALLAVVGFFLLLACVNVASLFLGRSMARQREFAIRAALGASRARQIRQWLTESLLLSCLGGACALLLTVWTEKYLATLVPRVLSTQFDMSVPGVDWRVFLFTSGVSVLTAVVFGLAPALKMLSPQLQSSLKDAGRGASRSRGSGNRLRALVISEVSLAVVLLVGAGLLIGNFRHLLHRDLGFPTANLLSFEITPSETRYPAGPRRAELARQLLARIGTAPGVSAVGVNTVNPLGGATWVAPLQFEDAASNPADTSVLANHRLISPGLLQAMSIPLLRGRDFTAQDNAGSQPVAIVSEALARRYWPGRDPLGQRLKVRRATAVWRTVVGVVGNVRDWNDTGEVAVTWYLPYAQAAETDAAVTIFLMVRARGDFTSSVRSVEEAIRQTDKTLAISETVRMDAFYVDSLSRERLGAYSVALFALFGLLLASLGTFGVVSYMTAQRTNEIGIRIALGASRESILGLILRQGLTLGGIGVASGKIGRAHV
jgi:predicted permease